MFSFSNLFGTTARGVIRSSICHTNPSVWHTCDLWSHLSTDRNNLGVVGKPQYSSFRKSKLGPDWSLSTPPKFGFSVHSRHNKKNKETIYCQRAGRINYGGWTLTRTPCGFAARSLSAAWRGGEGRGLKGLARMQTDKTDRVINAISVLHHGCTVVQAVVMVTSVLIGNGHFWIAGNKKPQNQLSPNCAKASTLV